MEVGFISRFMGVVYCQLLNNCQYNPEIYLRYPILLLYTGSRTTIPVIARLLR